jgi:hypothetical protein
MIHSSPVYSRKKEERKKKLPATVIKKIGRYMLWRGAWHECKGHRHSLAAWNMVSRSKREGGLGIIKMATQNDSLLMKNINKFFNKAGLPWVQLLRDNYYSNGQLPGHWKKGFSLVARYTETARSV